MSSFNHTQNYEHTPPPPSTGAMKAEYQITKQILKVTVSDGNLLGLVTKLQVEAEH